MENLFPALALMGLDGFLICACLGGFRPARNLSYSLATIIGICDGAALALGTTLRMHAYASDIHWLEMIVPIAIVTCGVYVLFLRSQERMSSFPRVVLVLLPILLSLDNFVAGLAGLHLSRLFEATLFSSLMSGGMAFLGIGLGVAIQGHLRVAPHRLAGYGLMAVGLVTALIP
jgi:hypothetical protein